MLQIRRQGLLFRVGAQNGLHVGGGKIANFQRKLLRRWVASQFLNECSLCPQDPRDGFKEMHRDADRPRLLGDRAVDGLPYPPRGVRAELETAPWVEFSDRPQKSHISFLDQ